METNQAAELVITRTLAAPRDLVFKVLTEKEHFAKWWGPKGFDLQVLEMDVRAGGRFLGRQESPQGHVMYGKFVYREIVAPERVELIHSITDEAGNTIQAPFSPDWPLEVLNIWTLSEEDGKTTFVMRGRPHNATEAQQKAFEAAMAGLNQGFAGTLQQLEDYLTSVQA